VKGKKIFEYERVRIINDSVFDTDKIKKESIDLIVTSPPYNVDIKYNTHDDQISYERYLEFSEKWMRRCYEWLKDDGRFCLNIPLDINKGGQQSVGADLTEIAKSDKVGFKYHSTIIWNEGNISRRTAWGSWMSASAPYVIAPVEVIIVLYKKSWKKTSGSRESDITRKEFMDLTNGLWTFSGEKKSRIGHPAPFPVELPRRCMKLFSYKGDTILDPFLGSGSTLVATRLNDRNGIGIDIDMRYCKIAIERLQKDTGLQIHKQPKREKSQKEIVLNFFKDNSNRDIQNSEVKDWIFRSGLKIPYYDRILRTLVKESILTKCEDGIHRYEGK
jgi:site-specific DNA-methyltransferase (adenine-specific)